MATHRCRALRDRDVSADTHFFDCGSAGNCRPICSSDRSHPADPRPINIGLDVDFWAIGHILAAIDPQGFPST